MHKTSSPSGGRPVFLRYTYSSTSSIRPFIFVLPPVGDAKTFPQTRQFMFVAVLPKIICSFLHFGHLVFTNFDNVSFSVVIFSSSGKIMGASCLDQIPLDGIRRKNMSNLKSKWENIVNYYFKVRM